MSFRNLVISSEQGVCDLRISEILNKRIELSWLHPDGHEFPLELAITAVRSKGFSIFSGFSRDLTERRGTEDALQKSGEQRRQAQKKEGKLGL